MNAVVTVSSIIMVIMISLLSSSFSLNQAEGQLLPRCPDGYQRNPLGLCEPVLNLTPNIQSCSMGYHQIPPGLCAPIVSSSLPLNNVTNQTQKQGSSLSQQPPNIGVASPLQSPQPLQQQPQAPLAQQQQWSTYQDPSGTFTVSYPSSWTSVPGRNAGIMFIAPEETFSDQYVNAAVLINIDTLPSVTNTLQAMTEYKLKSYSVSTPHDKLIQSQGTSLAGLPAHMVVVQFLNLGNFLDLWEIAKLMALEEWTVKGDKSFSILYITPVEKFEQYLPTAQQIINSFQILS